MITLPASGGFLELQELSGATPSANLLTGGLSGTQHRPGQPVRVPSNTPDGRTIEQGSTSIGPDITHLCLEGSLLRIPSDFLGATQICIAMFSVIQSTGVTRWACWGNIAAVYSADAKAFLLETASIIIEIRNRQPGENLGTGAALQHRPARTTDSSRSIFRLLPHRLQWLRVRHSDL